MSDGLASGPVRHYSLQGSSRVFLYTMKPILHLFGDRSKAQQFVRFAERKLAELKKLMKLLNLNMQNRLIRFANDNIEVYIESYHGIDKIRITAAEKGCKIDFVGTPVTGIAPFNVVFNDRSTAICNNSRWFWNFGNKGYVSYSAGRDYADGGGSELSYFENPFHDYNNVGQFDVSIKVWNPNTTDDYTSLSPTASETLTKEGIKEIFSSFCTYTPTQRDQVNQDAWDSFTAASWTIVSPATNGLSFYYSGGKCINSYLGTIFRAQKQRRTFDLTGISSDKIVTIGFGKNNTPVRFPFPFPNQSQGATAKVRMLGNSTGGMKVTVDGDPTEYLMWWRESPSSADDELLGSGAGEGGNDTPGGTKWSPVRTVVDLTPFIGSIITIETVDMDDYPILSSSVYHGSSPAFFWVGGWHTFMANGYEDPFKASQGVGEAIILNNAGGIKTKTKTNYITAN